MRVFTLTATLLALMALGSPSTAEPDWPRFRGPDGTGHTTEKGLLVTWDAKAVVWKTAIKGRGQS